MQVQNALMEVSRSPWKIIKYVFNPKVMSALKVCEPRMNAWWARHRFSWNASPAQDACWYCCLNEQHTWQAADTYSCSAWLLTGHEGRCRGWQKLKWCSWRACLSWRNGPTCCAEW